MENLAGQRSHPHTTAPGRGGGTTRALRRPGRWDPAEGAFGRIEVEGAVLNPEPCSVMMVSILSWF
jgi:hypothetical protein